MSILNGIDVSKHQGNIDWVKVKASNKVNFVIIRAGYGMYESQKDTKFDANLKGVKDNNIPYGFYWYSYAVTVEQAKKEAEVCLKVIKESNPTYPVFFDQEYEPSIKKLSKQLRTDICIAFMKKIEEAGFKTGLYCSYDWIKNWLYEKQLTKYDKWIAQYSNKCSYTGDNLSIWQYSSTGSISGISGNVDMNYCYVDYTQPKSGKWKKDSKGWWYQNSDGSYPKNDWLKVDGRWYWFDSKGYAVKGYYTIDGKNYYFAEKYALGSIKECQLIITNENGAIV